MAKKTIPKLFRPTQYGVPSTETHMADNQKVGLQEHSPANC
jgi:hypothetical protein